MLFDAAEQHTSDVEEITVGTLHGALCEHAFLPCHKRIHDGHLGLRDGKAKRCHEGTSHQAHGQDTHSEQHCTQHNAPDTGDAKHTPTLSLAAEKVPSLSRPTHTRITLWR